jgi:hypothetical protein
MKISFVRRGSLLVVLLAAFLPTSRLCAAEESKVGEKLPPIEAISLQLRPAGWSSQASFSGLANTSLFGVSWETPGFAWNALNVRFGVGLGNYRMSGDDIRFYALDIGLKWTLARASSTGMTPYVYLGYKSLRPYGDNQPIGSTVDSTNGPSGAFEGLIGTTWNHTFRPTENTEVQGGFFVEAGNITSNFRALPSSTNARVADGFLIRVGFLRYL